MLTLLIRKGFSPQQVDGFPSECKRSRKGALHLRPGVLTVTEDEWAFIQKERPDLAKSIQANAQRAARRPVPSSAIHTFVPPSPSEDTRKKRRRGESIPDAD